MAPSVPSLPGMKRHEIHRKKNQKRELPKLSTKRCTAAARRRGIEMLSVEVREMISNIVVEEFKRVGKEALVVSGMRYYPNEGRKNMRVWPQDVAYVLPFPVYGDPTLMRAKEKNPLLFHTKQQSRAKKHQQQQQQQQKKKKSAGQTEAAAADDAQEDNNNNANYDIESDNEEPQQQQQPSQEDEEEDNQGDA